MRPVYSPSEFIQMKGRGTRMHTFTYTDYTNHEAVIAIEKQQFKLVDFFAVCEYFNETYDYNVKINLPKPTPGSGRGGYGDSAASVGSSEVHDENNRQYGAIELGESDSLAQATQIAIGKEGMRIDQEMFRKFIEEISQDEELVKRDEYDRNAAIDYLKKEIFNKPSHFMNLEKMRRFFNLDRRLGVDEALDIVMGRVEKPRTKREIMTDKFEEAIVLSDLTNLLGSNPNLYRSAQSFFDAYVSSRNVQDAVDSGDYSQLFHSGELSFEEFKSLKQVNVADALMQYAQDYVEIDRLRV